MSSKSASLRRKANAKVPHSAKAVKEKSQSASFIDGIVGGKRVLIAQIPKPPREKAIEIQIRVALAAAGVMVMKHHVDNRDHARTGLGIGVADLICIVPPFGRLLAIEVKRPGYSPSDVKDHQRKWLAIVKRYGAIAGVASSVDEALALLDLARQSP